MNGEKGRFLATSDPNIREGILGKRKPGRYFRILAIDGGGVRGIIPAMVLRYIEAKTGRRIHDMFNLVAGTSTGALLGAMLIVPDKSKQPQYTSQDTLSLYKKECPKIFSRTLAKRATSMGGLMGPRYSAKAKRKVIEKYAGELKISDCLTDILVPAFDVRGGRPYFFKSINARIDDKYNYPLKDVLDATSAAPTYFQPCKVSGYDSPLEHGYRSFVDGALTANSPSLCAAIDALYIYKEKPEDILVMSLGCGDADIGVPFSEMCEWSGFKWAPYIAGALISSSTFTVGYHTDQIIHSENYWRFQAKVPNKHADIDNISSKNIQWLEDAGELLVRQNKERLDALCALLVEGMEPI